ncbi:MAG: class I SAM-dependent methyltransferase [Mesorhizobium sp.]|uniref:class I SAM-dependent methyltransferase n=1 Tax=Mesorhizobium sp. TaxID=1871066 RepID=UPI000FE6CB83|nr:class I SAM-dependent methyltransferase [Mesorhizobium sp.]RWO94081.1 MAG: class I SAM-dependent methyltransferase [Mesorhizobium sp.]RWQ42167.1 MAG: class I SAM-dependent methyltransferase [Mesorhizobium sp.]TIM50289.1 MAG: class I SAM-dependent methyltransferase [Mesorhizobium sp.]
MLTEVDGGYDQGYRVVENFWGTAPASLVAAFLRTQNPAGFRVLDVGAGEGKNSAAFTSAGACVDALECSAAAIQNGRKLFPGEHINWIQADAMEHAYPSCSYDIIICYGLIHCLPTEAAARDLILRLQNSLKRAGTIFVVAFNNGSHDLSAHPGFKPLLLSHDWFIQQFGGWRIDVASDSILFETHPHNKIPHHHSLTRLSAVKP